MIIEKKLRKNAKFLSQKLITEIDGGVHNACAQRFVSSTVLTWTLFILIYTGICLGAVHKLCRLKGGGGQKLPILLSKKTTKREEGSKISDFETT